jgi:hypothetical protein
LPAAKPPPPPPPATTEGAAPSANAAALIAAEAFDGTPSAPSTPGMASTLWPAAPDAVAIEHVTMDGDARIVLYRFFGVVALRAKQRAAGRLAAEEAKLERLTDRCMDQEFIPGAECACLAKGLSDPWVMLEALGTDPQVWKIARLVPAGAPDRWAVAVDKHLSDITAEQESAVVWAADLDDDGRLELHVVVDVMAMTCSPTFDDGGSLGYVLRIEDLSEQFGYAAGRRLEDDTDEINNDVTLIEWSAAPRRTPSGLTFEVNDGPLEITVDCPYQASADTWSCPANAIKKPFFRPEDRKDCRPIGLETWAKCRRPTW